MVKAPETAQPLALGMLGAAGSRLCAVRERIRNAARADLTRRARTRLQDGAANLRSGERSAAATAAAVAAVAAAAAAGSMVLNPEAPTNKVIYAADLFCGAGGATAGLLKAAQEMGYRVEMVAVNHWGTAIRTHETNYPKFAHLKMEVAKVDPLKAVPGGYLDLLLAGPECTHHSNAAGGRPRNKQSRATAMDIIHWLEVLDVRNVIIENVKEFLSWGPLDQHNKPDKRWKGYYFRLFLDCLRELGYTVEYRVLCAADHGDPTTRKRLFILATKGGSPAWPVATHCPAKDLSRFPGRKPWVAAREIIDWTLRGTSIYTRTADGKPELCDNTHTRICVGVRKFWPGLILEPGDGRQTEAKAAGKRRSKKRGAAEETEQPSQPLQPMLIVDRGTQPSHLASSAHSVDSPTATVCGGNHLYLAEPQLWSYLVNNKGNSDACDIDAPVPTQTAHAAHLAVAEPHMEPRMEPRMEPFVLPNEGFYRNNQPYDPAQAPLQTVTSRGAGGVVETFLLTFYGGNPGDTPEEAADKHARHCSNLEEPTPTVTGAGKIGVIETFLMAGEHTTEGHERRCYPLERPAPTVTGSGCMAVVDAEIHPDQPGVEPFLVGSGGPEGQGHPRSTEEPMRTLLGDNHNALIEPRVERVERAEAEPFLYYGYNKRDGSPYPGKPITDPLPTVTGEWQHLGVVESIVDPLLDPIVEAPMEPLLLRYNGSHKGRKDGDERMRGLDDPLGTLDTSNRFALCQFVIHYYSNGQCVASLADPLATVTTRDRFALIELVFVRSEQDLPVYKGRIVGWLDILYRMLEPHELALAHSFPPEFVFPDSRSDTVKMIGNSWPILTGAALCKAMLSRPGGLSRNLSQIRSGRDPREFIREARRLMDEDLVHTPTLFDLDILPHRREISA